MDCEARFALHLGQKGKGPQDREVAGDPAEAIAAFESVRITAQTVADAVQAHVTPIDPLAKDYLHNLETVATEIRNALLERP